MTDRVGEDHIETEPIDPGATTQRADGGVDEVDDQDAEHGDGAAAS